MARTRTMEHYTLKWAFHDAAPEALEPGDHIYKWSSSRHAYHGIVLQQDPAAEDIHDKIIILRLPCSCCSHNNGCTRAERETLRSFEARNQKVKFAGGLKVARYDVPAVETWVKRYGTCYAVQCDPTAEVLQRADTLLNGGEYRYDSRAPTKCEHLAFWCKTGIWQSRQIEGVRRAAWCSMGGAAVAAIRLHNPAVGVVSLLGGGLLRQIGYPVPTRAGDAPENSQDASEDDAAHFRIATPRNNFMIATPTAPGDHMMGPVQPQSDRLCIWYDQHAEAARNEMKSHMVPADTSTTDDQHAEAARNEMRSHIVPADTSATAQEEKHDSPTDSSSAVQELVDEEYVILEESAKK